MTGSRRYRERRYKHLKGRPMTVPREGYDTCHICGDQRPVEYLSVEQHKTVVPGSNEKVMEKITYCSDKAECTAAAPNFSFVRPQPKGSALNARHRRAPGE